MGMTTLAMDQKRKLAKYAKAGVMEYWIENLKDGVIHVYRDPVGNAYTTFLTLHRGDSVSPLAFPDISFKVTDLLG